MIFLVTEYSVFRENNVATDLHNIILHTLCSYRIAIYVRYVAVKG